MEGTTKADTSGSSGTWHSDPSEPVAAIANRSALDIEQAYRATALLLPMYTQSISLLPAVGGEPDGEELMGGGGAVSSGGLIDRIDKGDGVGESDLIGGSGAGYRGGGGIGDVVCADNVVDASSFLLFWLWLWFWLWLLVLEFDAVLLV
jgi:hypothetical protein